MAQIDILEDVVVPESPRTVDNEQLFVYVPVATYDNKGIASFSSDDFVIENGKVMLRVRLSEFEKTLSNKLDKYDKAGNGSILYGVTDDGEQAMFLSDRLPIEDTIAIRDENGNVKTNRPVENNDTMNKFYGHNTFANALKGNISGSAVAMKDVSPLEHELDVKVSSKNLIPYPYRQGTITTNGITFTDNGDGSITISGTATKGANFTLNKTDDTLIHSGTYTYSGQLGTILRCEFRPLSGNSFFYANADGAIEVTEDCYFTAYLYVTEGDTINATIYPLLEKGTVATSYAPYIEDISSVEVKRYGKNLLSYPYATTTKNENGITFTDNGDGTVTINGTATATSLYFVTDLSKPSVVNYDCVFSGIPKRIDGCRFEAWLKLADGNDKFPSDYGNGETIPKDSTIVYLCLIVESGTTVNNLVFKPQLEVGTTATPYEPYIEPTTYAVEADGSVNGVMPLYPSTTLVTDNRAIIECEYNRDINKAFEELRQIIISLGGNI